MSGFPGGGPPGGFGGLNNASLFGQNPMDIFGQGGGQGLANLMGSGGGIEAFKKNLKVLNLLYPDCELQ